MNKTTGHIKSLILLLGLLVPTVLGATDIKLRTSNDFLSDPNQSDDLYTAEIGLGFGVGSSGEIELGERIFTDRERGLRFDETFLRYSRDLSRRKLELHFGIGVVHVGHGAGRSLQNSVHRLVGSPELELDYLDRDEWFATTDIRLSRTLVDGRFGTLATSLDAQAAPGFRSWIQSSLDISHDSGPVELTARLGFVLHEVDFEVLAPRVASTSPTWGLGASMGRLSIQWSYNHYGTQSKHVELAYRLRWATTRRRGSPPDVPQGPNPLRPGSRPARDSDVGSRATSALQAEEAGALTKAGNPRSRSLPSEAN